MSESAPSPHVDNDGAPDETEELLEKFSRWDTLIDAHYGEWEKEAETCFDMVAGDQYEQDVITKMEAQGKIPVTFNRVAPNVDAVAGIEVENRQKVVYEPRTIGASSQNEVLTAAADWVRDECDAEHEESDASRDCLICGVGWMTTRVSYDDDPDGEIIVERIDTMQVRADPNARKSNYADKRYVRRKIQYSREEFEDLFPDESADGAPVSAKRSPVVVNPHDRYENGTEQDGDDDSVWVTEWQWYDTTPAYRVKFADGMRILDEATFTTLKDAAEAEGITVDYVVQKMKRFRRAFVASGRILDLNDLEVNAFTYHAMTGKRDRNKGVFYGLVRPMLDPQRFSNKLFSQILHIINTNAKGGLMAEEDAFVDPRKAEADWSSPDAITWIRSGKLPSIKEKGQTQYPQGMDRLMQESVTAIRDTTGINQELLGLAGTNQPGVLEAQRKKQAYSILSSFFDSFRRYRKEQGRVLIDFMRRYLSPQTLIRIVNDNGSPEWQAIGTAFQQDAVKYNVIVDDTPAGPNQKSVVFQMITQMMPLLMQADLGPDIWAELVKYSPLPTAVAEKISSKLLMQAQQGPPPPSPEQQAKINESQSKVAVNQAQAQHHAAQANRLNVDAQLAPAQAQADIAAKQAQADHTNVQAATHPQMMDAKTIVAETNAAKAIIDTANNLMGPQGPNTY